MSVVCGIAFASAVGKGRRETRDTRKKGDGDRSITEATDSRTVHSTVKYSTVRY